MGRYKRKYGRLPLRLEPPPEQQSEGKTFLIVVEGQKTEQLYLHGLREKLQLTSARVEVLHAGVTDPHNIVYAAMRLRKERADISLESLQVAYDEVWVVFDSEAQNHPRRKQLSSALKLAEENNIRVALSNPCFEFWLLLHWRYTTKPFVDAEAVIRALCKYVPDYKKSSPPLSELIESIGYAVKRAAQCRKHHCDCAGDGNPSSDIDLLVKSLNASALHSFRCF